MISARALAALPLLIASCFSASHGSESAFTQESHAGAIPPGLATALQGPRVLCVQDVTIAGDVEASLVRQAKAAGMPDEEVKRLLGDLKLRVEEHIYNLGANIPEAFVVYDDRERARREASLQIRCSIHSLDLVDNAQAGQAFWKIFDGSNKESAADFRGRVELVLIREGVVVAAKAGTASVHYVRASEGLLRESGPDGPVTEANYEHQRALVLSPLKRAAEAATECAWGELLRTLARPSSTAVAATSTHG